MSRYDKDISLAELAKMEILVHHTLRRILIEKDMETAKLFAAKLGKLAENSRQIIQKIKGV